MNDTVEVRALDAPPPPPQPPKRRLWTQPELTSHSLAVLTPERLYLAPLGSDPRPEMLEAIAAGEDVEELLGPLATIIELPGVCRVKLDLLTNSLNVDYLGREHSTGRVTLTFATSEAADTCFTRLWRRIGNGLKLSEYQTDKVQLARAPLAVLFVTLLVTAMLTLLISVAEDTGAARHAAQTSAALAGERVEVMPKSPLEGLVGWMNWKVVCALGGAVAAASQVWLYRRLTTPPASLELIRLD